MLILSTTDAWVIHERSFSVSEAQTLKTTIVSVIRRQETTGHGRNGILKKTRSSVICSFRTCSLSWSAQGNRWWEGLEPGTKQKWTALWRSALFSSTRLRSKNLMSGCTYRPFIPVCTGSGSGMQNPLANFIGVFSLVRDVRGFQVNPLCRHDITRSDRQIGNQISILELFLNDWGNGCLKFSFVFKGINYIFLYLKS